MLDLSTEELDSGAFAIGAPPAAIYVSPTHRYAFVLARGPVSHLLRWTCKTRSAVSS